MRTTFRDSQIQAEFEQNGFIVLDLFSEDEVRQMQEIYSNHTRFPFEPAFAITSMMPDFNYRKSISAALEKIYAPKVQEYLDDYQWYFGNYLVKYPNDDPKEGYVTLHQDPSHLDETQFRSVTMWAPLVDTNKENGGIYFVRGSHRLNNYPRGYGRYGACFFLYPELEPIMMKEHLEFIPLRAGQVIIFPATTFHFSEPNRSDSPRIVACGLLGPQEAQLRYYHQEDDQKIEVFEVDPEHYLGTPIFSRPDEGKYKKIDEIPPSVDSQNPESLKTILAALKARV